MTRRFQQMRAEERVTLAALRQQGQSLRWIGRLLGRSAGSLSRELKRHSTATGATSKAADVACRARRVAALAPCKLDVCRPLWPIVAHLLKNLWSPQQIAKAFR